MNPNILFQKPFYIVIIKGHVGNTLSSCCRAMSFSIAMGIYWEIFKHWIKGTRVVILDIPLLFEAKLDRLTKPIIVVWVDAETQEKRLVL